MELGYLYHSVISLVVTRKQIARLGEVEHTVSLTRKTMPQSLCKTIFRLYLITNNTIHFIALYGSQITHFFNLNYITTLEFKLCVYVITILFVRKLAWSLQNVTWETHRIVFSAKCDSTFLLDAYNAKFTDLASSAQAEQPTI